MLKEAEVPVPFALPALPLPANVETTPAGVILRIRWFSLSATYIFPLASTLKPTVPLKEAEVPVPFELPELPVPTKVDTTWACTWNDIRIATITKELKTKILKRVVIFFIKTLRLIKAKEIKKANNKQKSGIVSLNSTIPLW